MPEVRCTLCMLKFYSETVPPHDCEHIRIKKLETQFADLSEALTKLEKDTKYERRPQDVKEEKHQRVDMSTLKAQSRKLRPMYKALIALGEFSSEPRVIFMSKDSGCVYVKNLDTQSSFPNVTLGTFRGSRNSTDILPILDGFDIIAQSLNTNWRAERWVTKK